MATTEGTAVSYSQPSPPRLLCIRSRAASADAARLSTSPVARAEQVVPGFGTRVRQLSSGAQRGEVHRAALHRREIWLEADANGHLGLEVPEQYGGSAAHDYRFNARASRVCSGACRASPTCTSVSDSRCRE
ncbi:acyl-CoA dehydrogenase family protein [Rhodococcus oxybenzonivorans]|uniref:acyl-CoA dehydrogenase family protein n=1 Tax=Rhodococcus oxybenzonivorans TaxID=1990687 RepID=UPI003AAB8814